MKVWRIWVYTFFLPSSLALLQANVYGRPSRNSFAARATSDPNGDETSPPLKELFETLYPANSGTRIVWGVFKEKVDGFSSSEEEREELRRNAAESLTNIDDAERARRRQAGLVFSALTCGAS